MSRDYKNIKNQKNSGSWISSIITFITGLAAGLFIAFLAFLYHQEYQAQNTAKTEAPPDVPRKPLAQKQDQANEPQKPTFDFYKILPNREVNISEWEEQEQNETTPEAGNEAGMYILQVGSFKDYSAADEIKAQLALIGIDSEIQRVVINGQDIRHRVRIGPYKSMTELNKASKRLRENDLEFMILKLKLDEAEIGETTR